MEKRPFPGDVPGAELPGGGEHPGEPLTLAVGKRAFYTRFNLTDEQACAFGTDTMVSSLFSEDAEEGIKACLEKRTPVWKGK